MQCILEYICSYGTCILFPVMWFELAVHLQSEYVEVDAPHHSNCSSKLNWSSDLNMQVYDNHYFAKHLQSTYSSLGTPVERKNVVNCYQHFAKRKIQVHYK